jgi:hypothetical protein
MGITIHCQNPQRNPSRSTAHCSHRSKKLDSQAFQLRLRHAMETVLSEEYSPGLDHIKGTTNVAANALSCLWILNHPMDEEHFTEALPSELYTLDDEDLPETAFPLSDAFLGKAQSTDVAILKEAAKTKSLYSIQPFTGAEKTRELICHNGKIVVPKKLQSRIIQWYREYLGHPGINRTKKKHWSTPLVAKNEKPSHKLDDSLLCLSTKQVQDF